MRERLRLTSDFSPRKLPRLFFLALAPVDGLCGPRRVEQSLLLPTAEGRSQVPFTEESGSGRIPKEL